MNLVAATNSLFNFYARILSVPSDFNALVVADSFVFILVVAWSSSLSVLFRFSRSLSVFLLIWGLKVCWDSMAFFVNISFPDLYVASSF